MKKVLNILLLAIVVVIMGSCTKHDCVGEWHAFFYRSYDSSISETWDVVINNDGTCYGREVGSGRVDYTYQYEGTWKKISNDVIYVQMETGNIVGRSTYSNKDIEDAMSKARNDREANRIYERMQGLHTSVGSHVTTFYLRSDGAAAFTYENLDTTPHMLMNRK